MHRTRPTVHILIGGVDLDPPSPGFTPLLQMRLFISISLPKKEKDRIHRSARPLREREVPVRWTESENYHITLKYLGVVRPEKVDLIQGVMQRVGEATSPFPASIDGFGAFPTIRRPETLWAGIAATPELRCLKQDLEWGLAELGFERETRAFHPHITLGRATGEGGAGAFRGVDDLVAEMAHSGEFTVRAIDLVQSRNTKAGPLYSVLRTTRLSAG